MSSRYRCIHCEEVVQRGQRHSHSPADDLLRAVELELEGLGVADAELDELDISADLYFRIKRYLHGTKTDG